MPIQTLDGDVDASAAGDVLAHEHLWAPFGRASGDPDLELTCEDAIVADARAARAAGVRTVVEATTIDMGADVARIAAIGRRAGLQVVKSVGWFRSPTADPHVTSRAAGALSAHLVRSLVTGCAAGRRAGCLGEVGISGTRPTAAESLVLDATASAALATGAGVLLHTDDAANGAALLAALEARGVGTDQLQVGHLRVADPLGWHVEAAERGGTLAFDQLGHPARDPVDRAADRIADVLARVPEGRIVVSSDLGRRSRLQAFGGGGYAAGPRALLAALQARGIPTAALVGVAGAHAARFLTLRDVA